MQTRNSYTASHPTVAAGIQAVASACPEPTDTGAAIEQIMAAVRQRDHQVAMLLAATAAMLDLKAVRARLTSGSDAMLLSSCSFTSIVEAVGAARDIMSGIPALSEGPRPPG